MTTQIVRSVTELFDQACTEQFEALGCQTESVSGESHAHESMASFIVAGSEDLSICLVLKAPRVLLAQTMPIVDLERINDPVYQEDWNGELANRFLGRLKNKLVEFDCRLKIGLPELLTESELKHFKGDGQEVVRHFAISSELTESVVDCFLYIDVLNPSLNLTQAPNDPKAGDDGELVFL